MSKQREFDAEGFAHLLTSVQDGVVSREQLRELHAAPHQIRRLLRRKELNPVYPGVYVEHTGPLSWDQRAWAAVLYHWPAALARDSALPKPSQHAPIHVAVALDRTIKPVSGVVVHRTAGFDARVQWSKSPARIAVEHAAIDVALTKRDVAEQFRVFAEVCQSRATVPTRIITALTSRRRVPDRALLLELLADLDSGACSVLEREYLRLERKHGLPCADRQLAAVIAGRSAFRDAPYRLFKVVVELDGRAFHDNAADRDRDFERDLDTAVETKQLTVRLTYGQVFSRGCATIRKIATLLERRGWTGTFLPCPRCIGSNPGAT